MRFAIYGFMALNYIFFLLAYCIILLCVGTLFSRRVKSLEDFFLASRNLPAPWIFFSLSASWIGATSILVTVDEAYRQGVSAFWIIGLPAVLTVALFALFLARPIRQLPIFSLPDLVEMRYGRTVRHLASVLIIWYMILLASSQMVALGNFLKIFLKTSYFNCLILGTVIVLIYSVFGGFVSVVFTDGLQFFLLVAGIGGFFVLLIQSSAFQEIAQAAAGLEKLDYFNFFYNLKRNFLMALSFTLAWIISPIAWQRIQSARSVRSARYGLLATAIALLFFFGMVVGIGLFSLPLFQTGDWDVPLLSWIISTKTGFFLGGFLFVAVVAAIMSTMDTAINTGALSVTHDLYFQILPQKKGSHSVSVSRISTILVAAVAFLVATRFQNILKTLGLASEIMAEGLFVPGLAMLYLKKRWPAAGFLSLVAGGGFALLGFMCEAKLLIWNWPTWPNSVPYGLAVSLAGFMVGLLIDKCWGRFHQV
jgi:SSS family solute:Na+ symporter